MSAATATQLVSTVDNPESTPHYVALHVLLSTMHSELLWAAIIFIGIPLPSRRLQLRLHPSRHSKWSEAELPTSPGSTPSTQFRHAASMSQQPTSDTHPISNNYLARPRIHVFHAFAGGEEVVTEGSRVVGDVVVILLLTFLPLQICRVEVGKNSSLL